MLTDNLSNIGSAERRQYESAEPDHASLNFTAERFSSSSIKNKDGVKNYYQTLKLLLRTTRIGLNDPIRKTLWTDLAVTFNPSNNAEEFDPQFDNLTVNKLPTFVDPANARFFALNTKSQRHIATILWNLSQCKFLCNMLLCTKKINCVQKH